jgi:hypothetical protein
VVVLDAREDAAAGRLELTLLHHPTGAGQRLACDWVACAVPPRPADELWHALRVPLKARPFRGRRSRCTGWVTAWPPAGPTPR